MPVDIDTLEKRLSEIHEEGLRAELVFAINELRQLREMRAALEQYVGGLKRGPSSN